MRKKRISLKIISSLFGVIALCGLSVFFLFDHKKERQRVNADNPVTVVYGAHYDTIYDFTGICYSSYDDTYLDLRLTLSTDLLIYTQLANNGYQFLQWFKLQTTVSSYLLNPDSPVTYDYRIDVPPQFTNRGGASVVSNKVFTYESGNFNGLIANVTLTSLEMYLGSRSYAETYFTGYHSYFYNFSYWWLLNGADVFEQDYTNLSIVVPYYVRVYQGNTQVTTINCSYTNYSTQLSMINITNISYDISDYTDGYQQGYNAGYSDGQTAGYGQGFSNGENIGYNAGYAQAQEDDLQLINNAYQNGKADGYAEANNQNSTVVSIFSGILQVAMVPVNFFLAIFNFEILGINLSAFIRAIFTVVLTIIVLKTVLGKGGGGSDN